VRYIHAVIVELGAIYFDVKVSFVESCENVKKGKKERERKNMQNRKRH